MPCYHPVTGYRSIQGRDPKTGSWPLVFDSKKGYVDKPVVIPCGRCIGCRLERSRQWAVRCVLESKQWEENCFITLTYDKEHLPKDGSLNVRDFQLFMKSLRKEIKKKYGKQIRFFQCGEYGERFGRPHHHAAIFNFSFPDRRLYKMSGKIPLYVSDMLEKVWKRGHCPIGELTFESAAYIARYICKKVTGDKAEEHYGGKKPEYVTMSRKPGIGNNHGLKNYEDMKKIDGLVINGRVIRQGKYYDKLHTIHYPSEMEERRRIRRFHKREKDQRVLEYEENAVKKTIKKTLKRSFENG